MKDCAEANIRECTYRIRQVSVAIGQTAFSIHCKSSIYVRVFGNHGEALRGVLDAGWAERVLILPFLFPLSPLQSGKLTYRWLVSFIDSEVLLQEDGFIICLWWCNFGFRKKKKKEMVSFCASGFSHKGAELQ